MTSPAPSSGSEAEASFSGATESVTSLPPVLAASAWPTNAELIEDVAKLGYLKVTDLVLDATYGRGTWWRNWWPNHLITNDIVPGRASRCYDFREFPDDWEGNYDAVAFDPPYVAMGGRSTSTLPDFQDRYGLTDAPATPQALQRLINQGTYECHRVLRRGGILLVKCQSYVSSGKLWLGVHHTLTHARDIGLACVDMLQHVGSIRPQPGGRRQVHARQNYSTLLVLQK